MGSVHIRILPFPPVILCTSEHFHDRVRIDEGLPIPPGIYHRISSHMVSRVEEQRDREDTPPDKRDRLQAILDLARQYPEQCRQPELGNPVFIDLGSY